MLGRWGGGRTLTELARPWPPLENLPSRASFARTWSMGPASGRTRSVTLKASSGLPSGSVGPKRRARKSVLRLNGHTKSENPPGMKSVHSPLSTVGVVMGPFCVWASILVGALCSLLLLLWVSCSCLRARPTLLLSLPSDAPPRSCDIKPAYATHPQQRPWALHQPHPTGLALVPACGVPLPLPPVVARVSCRPGTAVPPRHVMASNQAKFRRCPCPFHSTRSLASPWHSPHT